MTAPILANCLKQISKDILNTCLKKITGTKLLVLDKKVFLPIEFIGASQLFKENAVDGVNRLGPEVPQTNAANIVFFCRPTVPTIRNIIHIVKNTISKKHYIVYIPEELPFCKNMFRTEGVAGYLDVLNSNWNWIPLDNDLYSLEMDTFFRFTSVDNDWTPLYQLSTAIQQLIDLNPKNTIKRILAKGELSSWVAERLLDTVINDFDHQPTFLPTDGKGQFLIEPETQTIPTDNALFFDSIILLDRSCDFISMCGTQLSYLGLVDEVMGLPTSCVTMEGSEPGKQQRIYFRSTDKILRLIGNRAFNDVGRILHERSLSLAEIIKNYKQTPQDVAGLASFVKQLPEVQQEQQSLSLHTHITERLRKQTGERRFKEQLEVEQALFLSQDNIGVGGTTGTSYSLAGEYSNPVSGSSGAAAEYIEERMGMGSSLWKVLRLMCLYSQVMSMKQSRYDNLKTAFLQTYGYHHIHTLLHAEQCGLLRNPDVKSPWNFAKASQRLHLYVDVDDKADRNDIGFLYCCYAPLSVRLVQEAFLRGWTHQQVDDVLRMLPGETHAYHIRYDHTTMPTSGLTAATSALNPSVSSGLDLGKIMESLPPPPDPRAASSTDADTPGPALAQISGGGAGFGDPTLTAPPPITSFTAPRNASVTKNGITITGDKEPAFALLDSSFVPTQESLGGAGSEGSTDMHGGATLVVFVGGATYAEIAGIRHFAEHACKRIVIATTAMLNGNRFMETLRDEVDNKLEWPRQRT